MGKRSALAWFTLFMLLIPGVTVRAAPVADAPSKPIPMVKWDKPLNVTLDLKGTAVEDALGLVAREGRLSYAIEGQISPNKKVTLSLSDANPVSALKLVCRSAGLKCELVEGVWMISEAPTVEVGGMKIPLIGADTLSEIERRGLNLGLSRKVAGTSGITWSDPIDIGGYFGVGRRVGERIAPPAFDGSDKLVDLEVKDAPMREAIAQLSKSSGVEIKVDDAVSKELKVAAKIRKMPLGEVLSLLVGQANLTYSVSFSEQEYFEPAGGLGRRVRLLEEQLQTTKKRVEAGVATQDELRTVEVALIEARNAAMRTKRIPLIYIVPRPELRVTGPGIGPPPLPRSSARPSRAKQSRG